MKVKATIGTETGRVVGYYDHRRRREGEVFEIASESDFSKRWMVKVEDGEESPVVEDSPKRRGRPPVSRDVI